MQRSLIIKHLNHITLKAWWSYITRLSLICFGAFTLSACASHPPFKQGDLQIDAEKFTGQWYVIANIPYFMEKNKVGSRTIYTKIGPNLYEDIFESREGDFSAPAEQLVGTARSLNDANTEWQSVFYWVLRSKFTILDVDPEYQTMLIGVRSRDLGWIFAREKTITQDEYDRAMRVFEEQGYDVSKFSKVPQLPEQIGTAGFQTVK